MGGTAGFSPSLEVFARKRETLLLLAFDRISRSTRYVIPLLYLTSEAKRRRVVDVTDALFELRCCVTLWLTSALFRTSRRYRPAANAEFQFRERAIGFIYTSQCRRAGQLNFNLPNVPHFHLATFSMLHGAADPLITSFP